jgi:mono/diheme cytochrome c family protein
MNVCVIKGRRGHGWVAILALCALRCSGGGDDTHPTSIDTGSQSGSDASADAAMSDGITMTDGGKKPDKNQMGGSGSNAPSSQSDVPCRPVKSFETVPPLTTVVMPEAAPTEQAIFTEDLFRQFKTNCGGCHVDNKLGGFQVLNREQFAEATKSRQAKISERLHSDDPTLYMPPAGTPSAKPFSERGTEDPVFQLAELFELWFAAGSPQDVFYKELPAVEMDTSSENPYTLTQATADLLSNMGSCVPKADIVGTDAGVMDEADSFFESLQSFSDLPKTLAETDLTSFESETLARQGVISFAPGYPLFSDNARKMRHVRVPRGKSITFNKDAQEFTIPDNTRFYKTFLKKVIDWDGNERYRKMETRLIVARADGPTQPDGSHPINALFASYAWNESETQATLVEDPRRDQTPFRDRLITYIVDEAKADDALANTEALDKVEALRAAGATRNYAIPGSDRCIQCHMGGHNQVFILGFTPLQINRRAHGSGGNIEETSDDELSQLQRLIDYKVVTGIDSIEKDVLPLEKSQGERSVRNEYELTAQAYMVGNCSHCHNPRGYPTVQNPVLRDLLSFYPDKTGGIFQFPLERTSPRIKRGKLQDVQIPYITPSLIDLEPPESDWDSGGYIAKYAPIQEAAGKWIYYMDAPWRSLIYRNVDSPFAYVEDFALYPHMPMNVPGFDCRVPKIMAEWMLSIPSRLRDPSIPESDNAPVSQGSLAVEEQPYVEVKQGQDGYDQAVADAEQRLTFYREGGRDSTRLASGNRTNPNQPPGFTHTGLRYAKYCPDTSDIVDPDVGADHLIPDESYPKPTSLPGLPQPAVVDASDPLYVFINSGDGVPNRAHWIVTDVTDPAGAWNPRRVDWQDVVVKQQTPTGDPRQQHVVQMLQSLKLTDGFKKFATTPQPFGLWQRKPGCNFASQKVAKDFDPTGLTPEQRAKVPSRPQWMDYRSNKFSGTGSSNDVFAVEPPMKPDDPIFMQSPGASVFGEICVNCHGPKYDSRGRQADNIILMTGGDTRVANLRDGLFGPVDMPGANRMRVFSAGPQTATPDEWAVRYMAWMGLGGTQRVIPAAILNLVGTAQVLGDQRVNSYNAAVESANMLSIAQQLCRQVLGESTDSTRNARVNTDIGAVIHAFGGKQLQGTALIQQNGDAEMWLQICTFANQPPVRVLKAEHEFTFGEFHVASWYPQTGYPSGSLIGDHRGGLASMGTNNLFPWCVLPPETPAEQAGADAWVQNHRKDRALPFCPTDWLNTAVAWTEVERETWSLQGAINAGVSVFYYLSQRSQEVAMGITPQPNYDQCDQLKP